MAPSPDQMFESMKKSMKEKTGKSLEDWLAVVKKSGLEKHGEIVGMLKGDHGMGHGYANLVAQSHLKTGALGTPGDDLLEAQYAGAKAALRPIYDAIVAAVRAFGSDAEISPKKTYVSLRRAKQFALVQPSTATRVDVGIVLKGTKPAGRLEASGSFNAMVTHRVKLSSVRDVDKVLVGWLRSAYDAAT